MQKEKKSLVYYMNALRRQQGISLGQLCEHGVQSAVYACTAGREKTLHINSIPLKHFLRCFPAPVLT